MGCGASTIKAEVGEKDNGVPIISPPVIGPPPVPESRTHVKERLEVEAGSNDYYMDQNALDEFDEGTVAENDKEVEEYQVGLYHAQPGEEIMMYFETQSPGLLYRIINGRHWRFYNASRVYEMHVQFKYSPSHTVDALGCTQLSKDEEGNTVADAVIYPNEMTDFVNASEAMVNSKIKALPLSEPFLQRKAAEYYEITEPELNSIMAPGNASSEEVLKWCVEHQMWFVDREFLPTQESIALGALKPMKTVPWARPQMYLQEVLHSQIRLFRRVPMPATVGQSVLGDSWVISGLSAVATHPKLVRSLFYHPYNPRLTSAENVYGAYRVSVCKNGWWTSVVVDSYLPVIGSLPKYTRSTPEVCEMWVSYVEKAYAKLHGSYARIVSGDPLMFIQDMTGFPTSRYDDEFCKSRHGKAIEFMHSLEDHLRKNRILLVHTPCRDRSLPGHDNDRHTLYTSSGLVMGHGYAVQRIVSFNEGGKSTILLQICNPWGEGVKWKGDWREDSPKWTMNPEAVEKCQYQSGDGNSFWVSSEEAQRFFSGVGVVFVNLLCYDYRVRGVFTRQVPSVVLRISTLISVQVTFILSLPDHRGTPAEEEDYAPILLSLCEGSSQNTTLRVEKNSHLDVEKPTKLFSFVQSRDVAMTVTLDPKRNPYYLIPRIISPDVDYPYTVGILTNEPFSLKTMECSFVQFPSQSKVFSNFAVFDSKESIKTTATYQFRPVNRSFPKEYTSSGILPI